MKPSGAKRGILKKKRKEGSAAIFGSRVSCMHARYVMHDLDRYEDYGFRKYRFVLL